MRTRVWLTSAALGAALLCGGAATAQAEPAPSGTGTESSAVTSGWVFVGKYRSYSACAADGRNSVQDWTCERGLDGRWSLYVWV